MKSLRLGSAFALLSFIVPAAYAGSPVREKTLEAAPQDLTVPLSRNELSAEIAMEQAQRDRAEAPDSSVELGTSSWTPGDLQTPSRIPSPGSYSREGLPAVFINTLHPLSSTVKLKVGAGLLGMHRFATLSSAGLTSQQEQSIYITSFRAGAEYSLVSLSTRRFSPYLTGALLPTLVITNRSALDDGETGFGMGIEAGAGTLIHVADAWDLNLNVSEVVGKAQSSSLTGFGVSGAVRMHL